MFSFHKPLICYLGSTYLEVYKENDRQTFTFPSDLVCYSEYIDEDRFGIALSQFFDQFDLRRSQGVIFLAPELVFLGETGVTSKRSLSDIEQFLSSVPLRRIDISAITIRKDSKKIIYATNSKLYESVVNIFKKHHVDIYSVVPASLFLNTTVGHSPTIQDLRSKMRDKRGFAPFDFLQNKHVENAKYETGRSEPEETPEAKTNMRKQYVLLGMSLLFLAGAILYLLFWTELVSNPWRQKTPSVEPLPLAKPITPSQPTPTITIYDKSSVKIQILNGSGIEGQAGELSSILQKSGYKDIQTGNTPVTERGSTLIYSALLPADALKEMVTLLENDLSKIETQATGETQEFDVIITTGRAQP